MKNIIFIEGVSGVGKSTAVAQLGQKLLNLGYSIRCHYEGDPDSPLDLCWVAYLTIPEYENILLTYPEFADELSKNIIFCGEYILLRYQVAQPHESRQIKFYSPDLHDILHKKEFCYNPTNIAPLSKFTEVFINFWKQFAESDEVKNDYAIFDASLVSHITNDLVRNYNASEDELVKHLETLIDTIRALNPIAFYLKTQNVGERLKDARKSRGQVAPTGEQIRFWERREQLDIPVLTKLNIESYIKDITKGNWNSAIDEMVSYLTVRQKP